ncbi:MAG: tail fiber domain-containing protein [Crocinitomicaceae bacterium]|nr:tail fiber domain-containing protein [Crocinitomicaceae bacterium]
MKVFYITALLLLCYGLNAQAPQSFSYQSVVRDNAGQLINNTNLGVQISIRQNSINGPIVYQETHQAATNANGLFTISVGQGNVSTGQFSSIDWANGPFFIGTAVDFSGGSNYTLMGTTQLMSVPYALYAATAGQTAGGSTGGNSLNAAYNEGGAGQGRSIEVNAGAVELNHSGGGNIGLKINTNQNSSFGVDIAHTGTGVGLRANSSNASNNFAALQGQTNSNDANNSAIIGENSGAGYAVSGQIPSNATGAAAIYGSNLRTTGGAGVSGIGVNGVVGTSNNPNGFGIYGVNNATTGNAVGTYGIGFNGIYGQTTNIANGWAGYFTADVGTDGGIYAIGPGVFNISDMRLKSSFEQIDNALEKVVLLNGKHYTIKTKHLNSKNQIEERQRKEFGVIAQEVEAIFPEMVEEKAIFSNTGDETLYKAVNYNQLIPVLIEAIKELKNEVDELRHQLEHQKK